MENRRHRASEELAAPESQLRGFGLPRKSSRKSKRESREQPPEIQIALDQETYGPTDFLACQYDVRLKSSHQVNAIETSVLWRTEGKGEENIGVHFFERRQQGSLNSGTFDVPQRISTVLPSSPMSYEGKIVSLMWLVRVRLFLEGGSQVTEDRVFKLGHVEAFSKIDPITDLVDSDDANELDSDSSSTEKSTSE